MSQSSGSRERMSAGPRAASFLASGTEILCALGLESCIVAISHECDHPASVLDRPRLSRPRFDPARLTSGEIDAAVRQAMQEHGSVYQIDAATLARVAPDLVLTQAVCEVCAVPTPGVRECVASLGLGARVLSLDAHTLAEILDSIASVAEAMGCPERGERVVAELQARLERVRAQVGELARPRVLALEWLEPPFAPGHWVPEMIAVAGGENLVGETGAHSRQISWDSLDGLDPDVLIVMPCGYGLPASLAEADRFATELLRVAPRAIDQGQAFVVDGSSWFNRSGPRVVTGVELTAALLHPGRFDAPPAHMARTWTPPA